MNFSLPSSTIISTFLAILGLGFYVGEYSHPVSGVSPYFIATGDFEDRVSLRNEIIQEGRKSREEEGIRGQIVKVIAKYKTGLKPGHLEKIPQLILRESKKYGYDPRLLTAVIITESSFYNWARSHRGALGLMQIRPRTAAALAAETQLEWKGKPTLYDPGSNIALGAYYLDKLIKRFGGIELALEAYNHGPTRLAQYLRKGVQPKVYSRKVIDRYEMIRSEQI